MPAKSITCRSVVSRHYVKAPRLVVIPSRAIASWKLEKTTVLEARINGIDVGRRTIKRWDAERWWIDLTDPMCRALGVDVGSPVRVELRLADSTPPGELTAVLREPAARRRWDALTEAQRRMLTEEIASAKQSATRERRARKALLG